MFFIKYIRGSLAGWDSHCRCGAPCALLIFCFVFCFLSVPGMSAQGDELAQRALFVSTVQDPPVLSSREEISRVVDFAKKARIKILFVQIYRSNQSWFPSTVADSRPYEDCFKKVFQDPFALLITQAHQQGIQVHAWLNLLSLGANQDADFLKKYGPDILTRNLEKKKRIEDYKIDDQYFLEPGDPRVIGGLSEVVEEIVKTYPDLDGILFDYIRYPDLHPAYGYTKINMDRFKQAAGVSRIIEKSASWKSWKRARVTELLSTLAQKARLLHTNIQVAATGCMPYSRAYDEAFQDWALWVDSGLVDFVAMMNYSEDPREFAAENEAMKNKVADFKRVKIGIGVYKFGKNPKGFEQEFNSCEAFGGTCAIFHYGSLVQNPSLVNFLLKEQNDGK